jgi:hypothetical protein
MDQVGRGCFSLELTPLPIIVTFRASNYRDMARPASADDQPDSRLFRIYALMLLHTMYAE